jgi:hypothetical protein
MLTVGLAATGGAAVNERLKANLNIAHGHDTIDGACA